MTAAAPELIKLPSAELKQLDDSKFRAGVEALSEGQLQKFAAMRALTPSQQSLLNARMTDLGIAPALAPKKEGNMLAYGAFGALCALAPLVGFFAYRLFAG